MEMKKSKQENFVTLFENIVDNGKVELTQEWNYSDHEAFLNECYDCGCWEDLLSENQIKNLAKYCYVLPDRLSFKLLSNLNDNNEGGGHVENVIALHKQPDVAEKVWNFLVSEDKKN